MKQLELEPLSEGQKGLWLFHKLDLKAGVSQTLPICFTIKTIVDISLFRQACEFVLKHSPLLSSILVLLSPEGIDVTICAKIEHEFSVW